MRENHERRRTLDAVSRHGLLAFVVGTAAALIVSEGSAHTRLETTDAGISTAWARPEHRFDPGTGAADCVEQSIRVVADERGLRVDTPGGDVWLALVAWGRGSTKPVARVAPRFGGSRVTFARSRAGVDEWFVNGPRGVEHGFDVSRRPPGRGPLRFVIATEGSLAPLGVDDGIAFVRSDGARVLRYDQAFARDVDGRELEITLDVDHGAIVITVDDEEARYPIEIDPLIWREGSVLTDSVPPGSGFGFEMSMDGDTLAVGGGGSDAVSLFRRSGTTWALEQRIASPEPSAAFGRSVAVHGTTLVVGAPGADGAVGADAGAVFVYERSAGVWTLRARLEASDASAGASFGATLDFDGTRIAVVGDCAGSSDTPGAVYVLERVASGWAEAQRLVASDSARRDCFALRKFVAIDGDRIALGAPSQRNASGLRVGAAFVFERSPTGWAETARFDPPPRDWQSLFGLEVDLDGDVLVIGEPLAGGIVVPPARGGSVHIFRHGAGGWALEAELGPDERAAGSFGYALALRPGRLVTTALDQSDPARTSPGVADIFMHSSSGWAREVTLTPSLDIAGMSFGHEVALDGNDLAVSYFSTEETPRVFTFALRHTDGDACASDDDCHSGSCVDGVCCDSACGGGAADDCMACSVAAGAASDGVCGAVGAGAMHVCRPETGACDIAEVCDGASTSCPADVVLDASVVCRDAAGPCDVEERCGAGPECPIDALLGGGVVCRASAAACDAEERCDGASAECPPDALAGTDTVCRAAAYTCDAEERCDGSSLECPPDGSAPDGTECSDGIACNGAEVCVAVMCSAGAPLDCDDGDACTVDSCAEPGGCVHERVCCARDAECDDGDACTIDSCEAERCVHVPACDASSLDGGSLDGGRSDGGPTFTSWGCGCRAAGSSPPRSLWLVAIALIALLARRTRRCCHSWPAGGARTSRRRRSAPPAQAR